MSNNKNFPGRKWLSEAKYITEETRQEVIALVEEARSRGCQHVGVRPASYLGPDPCPPLVCVTYNHHASVYGRVCQASEAASA